MHLVHATFSGAPSSLALDVGYTPYDQGIRHIATLAGYLSYGLMALTVCFGILTTTGWARRLVSRPRMSGTHMVLAVMALSFGVLHGVSYVFQTGQSFRPINAIVPFVAGGEISVGMGIIGLDLGIAVAISILVQKKLGYRRWHIVHWIAYVSFAASLAHTFTASAEVQALRLLGVGVLGCAAACGLLFLLRLLPARAAAGLRIAPEES
ncbi:MAG: hypothetical protein EPN48_12590 [Microbacteriaceae bacterium]|nr:MAG: hypothetical protein EPN48_12590 [Microbacteriaceae bacterium]